MDSREMEKGAHQGEEDEPRSQYNDSADHTLCIPDRLVLWLESMEDLLLGSESWFASPCGEVMSFTKDGSEDGSWQRQVTEWVS